MLLWSPQTDEITDGSVDVSRMRNRYIGGAGKAAVMGYRRDVDVRRGFFAPSSNTAAAVVAVAARSPQR